MSIAERPPLIYCATCRVCMKCYVGKSGKDTLEGKKRLHENLARRGSTLIFHRAMRKYGFDAFDWVVLKANIDLDDLDPWERRFIRKLKTKMPNGYNMTDGGDGASGWSEEVRDKHLKSTRAANNRPDRRARQSAAMRDRWKDPKYRKRMSDVHKITMNKPEIKMNNAASLRKKWADPEYRSKQTATRSRSDYKDKVSASNKDAHANPDIKAKYCAAQNRPDVRKKKSSSLKKTWAKRKKAASGICLS